MARTALASQAAVDEGLNLALTAANVDGHSIDADAILVVNNGSASPINVTIVTGGTMEGHAVADKVIAVPAGALRYIGDLQGSAYAQPSGADRGKVYVDFSAVATVTCAALLNA